MALRPIDNAMPVPPPERPKKQLKLSLSQKQPPPPPDSDVNDENKAPPPDASIDYVPSDQLTALEQDMIEGLESKDWLKLCASLNMARRFAIFHSDLLLPNLEKTMTVLVKAMKNPRSALCKTSIMASSDIVSAYGDKLLDSTTDAFDSLLLQLLLKSSQDKKFVCEEADRALNSMVRSITPLSLLQKLKIYGSHSNLRVRAKAAVYISSAVAKMGLEAMTEFGLVPLVKMGIALLSDKLPEAREAARKIVVSIYGAYTRDEEEEEKKQEVWQNFCESNLTAVHAQSLIKITGSI
ncbi:TOG array regulator of axonemal microtubules protein 1 [Linum perenne]